MIETFTRLFEASLAVLTDAGKGDIVLYATTYVIIMVASISMRRAGESLRAL